MAELKTKPTGASVDAFIDGIGNEARREDCRTLLGLIGKATGEKPAMWGPGIVGFGSYRYRYETGREGDWFLAGFSPRKQALTVYVMAGVERYAPLLAKLGRHTAGKGCVYVKRLSDIDIDVLSELVTKSSEWLRTHGPGL